MAEVKGTILKAWMTFLEERYGAQKVSEAVETLQPADRALLKAVLLDSSWYPLDAQYAASRLMMTLVTRADADIVFQLGRYLARYVYTGVYRKMIADNPLKHIEKFG